jgi:hypothetical protein
VSNERQIHIVYRPKVSNERLQQFLKSLSHATFFIIIQKFHMSESGRFCQPYMVSAHFLYLGKVEFMGEGTLPPAYTFPSYTTYTPSHNPVITGTQIDDVLASPSPSPEPEITPLALIPTPAPTVLPIKPTSCRKVGCPKIDSTQAPIPFLNY